VGSLALLLGAVPSDASTPEWNIARIGAPGSAAGTVVAVIDTGVDDRHPAFTGRVLPTVDVIGGGQGDPNGHGTHVAGTAAGADAGCGSIGVAPDARILPVKVLDAEGEGTVEAVVEGIRRAADAGATVINLSLGTDVVLRSVSGSGLEEAIRYAWSKGSITVLAAGNDGLFGGLFGSGYGDVPAVVVTATDHEDRVAPYATSIGSADWGIAAPGGDGSGDMGRDILSAFPDQRCALHAGTSMAAPHVSGALAVLRASGLPPQRAVEHLLSTARDLGPEGRDSTYGHGLVDLGAALATLGATPPTTVDADPAPPATDPAPPAGDTASQPVPAPGPDRSAGPGTTTATRTPEAAAHDGAAGASPGAPPAPRSSTTGDGGAPDGAGVDESAQAVVVDEADDDVPGALVAVAAVALGAVGLGAGYAGLRLRRLG